MPAAAVIPAPIAYINAVAVKKLVVGFGAGECFGPSCAFGSARTTPLLPPLFYSRGNDSPADTHFIGG